MNRLLYIIWVLVITLFFTNVNALALSAESEVDIAAQKFIASKPKEQELSLDKVIKKYIALENKYLSKSAGLSNLQVMQRSEVFGNVDFYHPDKWVQNYQGKIKLVRIPYQSYDGKAMQNVEALVILPAIKQPLGVVLFFHSTVNGKLNSPALNFDDYKTEMWMTSFVAAGYAVVAPDYIGLGVDYKVPHPYVFYPQYNANDGKNALVAFNKYLKANGISLQKKTLPLFVSGYSEGAAYALWFSRLYQESAGFSREVKTSGYQFKQVTAIDGAYDVTNVMAPFLLSSQIDRATNNYSIVSSWWGTLLKPTLIVQIFDAYSYHTGTPLKELYNPSFFSLKCSYLPSFLCKPTYITSGATLPLMFMTPETTFAIVAKTFLAANFKTSNGATFSIFNNQAQPLARNNMFDYRLMFQVTKHADIVDWKSTIPTTLVSLKHDSVVPVANTDNAYQGMLKHGSTNLQYIKINNELFKAPGIISDNPTDHVGFEKYAVFIALHQFNLALTPTNK